MFWLYFIAAIFLLFAANYILNIIFPTGACRAWFIIGIALLSAAFSVGLILSSFFYEYETGQFWQSSVTVTMIVICLAVGLTIALSRAGWLDPGKINADILKEN